MIISFKATKSTTNNQILNKFSFLSEKFKTWNILKLLILYIDTYIFNCYLQYL